MIKGLLKAIATELKEDQSDVKINDLHIVADWVVDFESLDVFLRIRSYRFQVILVLSYLISSKRLAYYSVISEIWYKPNFRVQIIFTFSLSQPIPFGLHRGVWVKSDNQERFDCSTTRCKNSPDLRVRVVVIILRILVHGCHINKPERTYVTTVNLQAYLRGTGWKSETLGSPPPFWRIKFFFGG